MLVSFFIGTAQDGPFLWSQHHPWLVALSVLMAVLAWVLALEMAALARRAGTGWVRQMARGSGAMALEGRHLVDALHWHDGFCGVRKRPI